MNKKLLSKKIKIILYDNRLPLFFVFFWFLAGLSVFFFFFKFDFFEALKACLFFKRIEGDFSSAYSMWSQAFIFGVVFSFLFHNIIEKYNPERGCRMMAKEMRDHIVVVGYSHLGERLINHFRQNKIPYCLIEKDKEKIDEILAQGEPVVVDNAKEFDALKDANIGVAKAVIIASNNLETALLVTKRVREYNKGCAIITRCFQDEFAEVIESLGANEVISSSKNAFENLLKILKV